MATQILSHGPAHFSSGSSSYTSPMYPSYSNYHDFSASQQPGYCYDADQPNMTYASSENWPNQSSSLRRVSSRSPSAKHERTPIRHHNLSISRSRSSSKPDSLLAYATEQSIQQQQQHSTSTTPLLQQTTPSTSPAIFSPQSYSSMPPASPFVQNPQFYDNSSPQFPDLQGPHSGHGHALPEYYQMSRQEMHASPPGNALLSPSNSLFMANSGHSRSMQMSSMTGATMSFPPMSATLESTRGGIEISSSRNKPQCWDHGCNGRQFSTFSNLLRHQREKSGTAAKARCPHCNTEFTRTTARNGHMYGGKCKGMADASRRSSSVDEETSET